MAGVWCTRCWTNLVATKAAVVQHFHANHGGPPSPDEISAALAREQPIKRRSRARALLRADAHAARVVRLRAETDTAAQETTRLHARRAARAKITPEFRAAALAKALAKGATRLGRVALRRFWRQSKRHGRYAAMVYEATVTAEPVKKMSRKNYARMMRNRGRGILDDARTPRSDLRKIDR